MYSKLFLCIVLFNIVVVESRLGRLRGGMRGGPGGKGQKFLRWAKTHKTEIVIGVGMVTDLIFDLIEVLSSGDEEDRKKLFFIIFL